jgi:hypothetical protein
MTKYLEIIDIDIPVIDVFSPSKYPSTGLFLNKPNNQLFIFDGLTVSMVGPMGVLAKLPVIDKLEKSIDNSQLLANSMLKLAAIMKNPELAMGLIND